MSKSVTDVLNTIPKDNDEEIKRFNVKIFLIYIAVGFVVGILCFSILFFLL